MKPAISVTSLIACAVIAGAFTVGFLTGPALADEPQVKPEPFQFHFAFNPSDVTTMPRAEKMLVRLEQQVRTYCGGNRKMTLNEQKYVTTCINETMRTSVAKFGSDMVAQAYQSRAAG